MSETFPLITPPSNNATINFHADFFPPTDKHIMTEDRRNIPIGLIYDIHADDPNPTELDIYAGFMERGYHIELAEAIQKLADEATNKKTRTPQMGKFYTSLRIGNTSHPHAYDIRSYVLGSHFSHSDYPSLLLHDTVTAPPESHPLATLAFRTLLLASEQYDNLTRQLTTESVRQSHIQVTYQRDHVIARTNNEHPSLRLFAKKIDEHEKKARR